MQKTRAQIEFARDQAIERGNRLVAQMEKAAALMRSGHFQEALSALSANHRIPDSAPVPGDFAPDTIARLQSRARVAREKHAGNAHMLAALTEETGELARALLEDGAVEDEALDVAVVALRILEEGDADFMAQHAGALPDIDLEVIRNDD